MSETRTVLDVLKHIASNRETGRLELNASGTYGTLLFNEGQLIDARLGSLSGFQAVNAAVSLRDVEMSFDHVAPASHSSTINASERVVLQRFFGIEAAEIEEPRDQVEPDWNETPEQVVPLTEVEDIPQTDLEETPTVEVQRPVRSHPGVFARGVSVPRIAVAVCLALLLGLAAGAIVLRSKKESPQQTAAAAPAAVAPEPVSEPPVQDLSGEWRVINTVEKTAYKSYDNLRVGFRLKIDQRGNEFTAKGEKFSENGRTLPADSRTPINVTGTIDGDKVVATFVEDGRTRRTNGRFVWKLQDGGEVLAGTFVSNAAKSSGRSAVTRQ